MRSATLRSYAGQAALPGGKSDTIYETPMQTARREASEEIGLPMPAFPLQNDPSAIVRTDISALVPPDHPHSTKFSPPTPHLPSPFKIEHLCQLPTSLAKTELGVRPCVAFLSSSAGRPSLSGDVETALIPRLDAKEVAAVFSGPLHNFLKLQDEDLEERSVDGEWYKGSWTDWHDTRFRMHNFYVPITNHAVTRPQKAANARKPKNRVPRQRLSLVQRITRGAVAAGEELGRTLYPGPAKKIAYPAASRTIPYRDIPQPYSEENPDPLDTLQRFRVFGMTARMLVDCARIAYAEEPEFEHNSDLGDEELIGKLIEVGKLESERHKGDEFKGDDIIHALRGQSFGGVMTEKLPPRGRL